MCAPHELPTTVAGLISLLQKCRKEKNLASALAVYNHIRRHRMESQTIVGNYLAPTLADCGAPDEANQVLQRLPYRNERLWTSIMSSYNDRSEPQHAFTLYTRMQADGVPPSTFTFVVALKACAGLKDWVKGQQMHTDIVQTGYERDVFAGNALVDMYAKCGSFLDALEASRMLPVRDALTWTAVITGYIEHGHFQEAVECFETMQEDGVSPNVVTVVCILRAVAGTSSLEKGLEVHTYVVLCGFEGDQAVGNTLVGMYNKCGSLSCAKEVFNKLPSHDVVSWNALIGGYADHDLSENVLKAHRQMQVGGVSLDAVTFVCVLKACGSLKAVDFGRKIHADVAEKGFDKSCVVGNALVDMYARCSMMVEAEEVLWKLPLRDVVSWNALILGYAEQASGGQVFTCFEKMLEDGIVPDSVTYVSTLKACNGSKEALVQGQYLHKGLTLLGCERNIIIGSSLVDMYAKAGLLVDAQKIFDNLPSRHVTVWTALIAGYAEYGSCTDTLECYTKMKSDAISPDPGMFVCLLKAFKVNGALFNLHELHSDVVQRGFDQVFLVCGILVDVYAKLGSLLEAQKVFDILPVRDVFSWSTMIRGYGMNHEGMNAIKCFKSMQDEGVKLDDITFTCLLSACSRTQLISEGQEFFIAMRDKHGFLPTAEHYACLVDLLAKSGHLQEAKKYLEGMLCPPVLTTLLTACKFHGEASLGQNCFQQLTR